MKKLSLVKKLNLLIFCMIFVSGLVAFVQFKSSNDSLVRSVEQKFFADSKTISNAISKAFYERYYDVQAFALNQGLKDFRYKEKMKELLNSLSATYGVYDVIMIVDRNGDFVAASDSDSFGFSYDPSTLKKNYAGAEWFKRSMAGEFTKGKIFSGTYVEPAQIDAVTSGAIGKNIYGTSFSTKLKNDKGDTIGVITCRANMKWISNIFKDAYQGLKAQGFNSVEFALLDKSGTLLFSYDPFVAKTESFVYDDALLGKLNLGAGNRGAAKLLTGEEGSSYSTHPVKKYEELTGHSHVDSDTFVNDFKWGVLVRIGKSQALGTILQNENIFLATILLTMFMALLISYFAVRLIGKQFTADSSKLRAVTDTNLSLSQTLCSTSEAVASAAIEQSSAIQESVSALSEMASMISQTSTSAKVSMDVVQRVNEKTKDGERVMEEMTFAIKTIEDANQQFQKVSQIILEVSDKTNIINDIVFKTQLLSFNASIEAARAGQHGRGFAVVAEEVGNLAKVSGNAAKDIESMLKDSQKQVQSIVSSLQDKVTKCSTVSSQAVKSFKDIAVDVEGIVSQIRGITDACEQQELGIQQTTTAMNQIDSATQKNSLNADDASKAARLLQDESVKLSEVTEHISTMINGASAFKVNTAQEKEKSGPVASVVSLDKALQTLVEKRKSKNDNKKVS